MVVYITEKSLWAGPTQEKREELVGGTHPWLVSLWLVLVGGTHPGGGDFLKGISPVVKVNSHITGLLTMSELQ